MINNKILLSYYLVAIILLLGSSSCFLKKSQDNTSRSSKTGWKYNEGKNGGFFVNNKHSLIVGPGLIPIEGGTFILGGSLGEDVYFGHYVTPKRITVPSFFMDETEVANIDWLEYLHWIKNNFSEDERIYYEALPDTLVWRNNELSYNEPLINNYLRHPAYQTYPIVGVTWEQAAEYCSWRTDRVNEKILREKGILKNWGEEYLKKKKKRKKNEPVIVEKDDKSPKLPFNREVYLSGNFRGKKVDGSKMPTDKYKKFLNSQKEKQAGKVSKKDRKSNQTQENFSRPVGIEDGILTEPYRLPTEAEWEYAALGLIGNSKFEEISDSRLYPWNGLGIRSAEKKTQGMFLANFKRRSGDYMGTAGYLNDGGSISVPVKSMLANDFGLYHMSGNVSEWTQDVYRQLTPQDVDDFSPFRGNEYMEKKYTDISKGVLETDKYGRAKYVKAKSKNKLTWEERIKQLGKSEDESTADNNEAFDGELQADFFSDQQEEDAFNPNFSDFKDQIPDELYGKSTLINNYARVYKGGSWNDRSYWLNPATKRFLAQDKASASIGFRCAMSMVGDQIVYSESPVVKSLTKKSKKRK